MSGPAKSQAARALWSVAVAACLLAQPLAVLLHVAAEEHLPAGDHAHAAHLHTEQPHEHGPGDHRDGEDHGPHPAGEHWDEVVKSPAPGKDVRTALALPAARPVTVATAAWTQARPLDVTAEPSPPPPRPGDPRAPPFHS